MTGKPGPCVEEVADGDARGGVRLFLSFYFYDDI